MSCRECKTHKHTHTHKCVNKHTDTKIITAWAQLSFFCFCSSCYLVWIWWRFKNDTFNVNIVLLNAENVICFQGARVFDIRLTHMQTPIHWWTDRIQSLQFNIWNWTWKRDTRSRTNATFLFVRHFDLIFVSRQLNLSSPSVSYNIL